VGRGGFIHLPFAPTQVKRAEPSLPLEVMTEAIALAIEVSLRTRRDRRVSGGRET
jgi:pyrrolidone-carboxylate peptidase